MANKLSNGEYAIGEPGSPVREEQMNRIAKQEAERRLELPDGHDYGSTSKASEYVKAFMEGAEWQRKH